MTHTSNQSHSERRGRRLKRIGHGGVIRSRTALETMTDASLWATIFGATACFGGRAAIGQFILVIGASLTAALWLLNHLISQDSEYTWTGSEPLWLIGIVIGLLQIVPLPSPWIDHISPQLGQLLLSPSEHNREGVGEVVWNQLSMAPWETASGVATFASYAFLFIVLVQRTRTKSDVERMMLSVGVIAIAMAVFSFVQYAFSNGKFYWIYSHPYRSTEHGPTGCFTNRNHLAQFLALGIGPLIGCTLKRMEPKESESNCADDRSGALRDSTTDWRHLELLALLIGLACTVITALSTLSRGGLLAVGISIGVSIGGLRHLGLMSVKLCLGLFIVALGVGVVFNFTGNEEYLASRLEGQSGRDRIWQSNLAVAHDFPVLGTGIGTHPDAHWLHLSKPIDGGEFSHAENGYLQVMSETGFVGLGLAILFIVVSLRWCFRVMRNPDRNVGLNGAIVLASLLTNVVHAVGDFFWYTPSCMLLLAIQLACVCRLSHLTRINALEGNRESVLQGNPVAGSRLVACGALCCVVGASLWMAYIKLPAALAESDQMWAATLSRRGREFYSDNDDYRAAQRERWQSLIRAARLNPHNSRFLEEAAQAYIECFNERQETSQNPIPLGQLRDAVKASQFESQAATREWLNRAVGENVKLLRLAIKTFRKALRESPLRAESYIELVELGFVVGMSESTEATYVRHASRLRPRDSKILFAVGREALLKGDSDRAMESWRIAFQQSASLRKIIAELLASQLEPAYLLDKLAPDWNSIALLAGAFERAGRQNEAHELWNRYIRDGRRRLKVSMDDTEYLNVVLNLRDAHQAMRESGHGIRMMTLGLKRLPDSFPLRITLGRDLFTQGRYVEAADHLQWCAARQPDDSALQNLTAHALEEKLKSSTPQERKNGNGSPENVPR